MGSEAQASSTLTAGIRAWEMTVMIPTHGIQKKNHSSWPRSQPRSWPRSSLDPPEPTPAICRSSSCSSSMNDGRKLAEQIEDEGIVLLRNEGNTLPLPSSTKHVNVFGWSSTEWVASGSGSAQTTGTSTTFLDALSKAGIEYNTELTDMYRGFQGNRPYASSGALNSHSSEFCRLYEPDINDRSCYSEQLLQDARDYSDTAIVVISRVSGESVDCPSQQYRVHNRDGSVDVDVTRSYLELSQEEERLLRYVGKNYKHVVVVVNSTNAMELGEVETLPGVGACCWLPSWPRAWWRWRRRSGLR